MHPPQQTRAVQHVYYIISHVACLFSQKESAATKCLRGVCRSSHTEDVWRKAGAQSRTQAEVRWVHDSRDAEFT